MDEIDLIDSGEALMEALRGEHTEKENGREVPVYGPARLFTQGIHYAPWRPWNRPEGFTLVAVDDKNRLVASMSADGPEGARQARRELNVLLEMFAPESYKDSYDDDGADDMHGEEWKDK